MTTDYNQIADQYQRAKQQAWRARIEEYSFMKLIGDLTGKKVVDMACGEGFFTRKLKQAGAAQLTGFDISASMIELAQAQEKKDPLGIEYRVEDARTLVPQQDFDVAVSAWLLVYAHNRQELADMARGIASRLRPGGRFVTFTTNPDLYSFQPRVDYRKYGFTITLADHAYDGAPILFTLLHEDFKLEIENYYLPVSAYETAFRDAGFRDFKVTLPELGPHPTGQDDRAFWETAIQYPFAIMVECYKG